MIKKNHGLPKRMEERSFRNFGKIGAFVYNCMAINYCKK